MNSVARFLEARGRTADALEVATDPDYRFELAVQLSKLDVALEIAETADSEGKWRQLSELAMSSGKLQACKFDPQCLFSLCYWEFLDQAHYVSGKMQACMFLSSTCVVCAIT